MERIKDKHIGKRIWVLGSGGSLLQFDQKKIPKDDIIIACNSSNYNVTAPHYAAFTDGTANYSNWYLKYKNKRKTTILLFNTEIQKLTNNTLYIEKDFHRWKFNPNDTKVIGGYDVIHCAVHCAHHMGASEIILVGVDLKHFSAKHKHANSQEVIDETPEALKEQIKINIEANQSLFDGYLGASLGGWELIHSHNKLNVFTISKDTNLKLYPHKQFSELCSK